MLNWPCFLLVCFSSSWLWFCHRLCPWINKRTITETELRLRIFSRSPHVHLMEKIHFYFNQPDTQAAQSLTFHFHKCKVYFYASRLFAYILHTYSNPNMGCGHAGKDKVRCIISCDLCCLCHVTYQPGLTKWRIKNTPVSQVISGVIKTHFLLFSYNLTPSTLSFSCNFRHKCQRKQCKMT